ncbi:MAG: DNA glycosylase AlkZ-like family protein [Acidimicrobiia bacterium]
MADHLDREQWHRQLLQRDRDLAVEEAVEATAGIYSTAPTSYLSCVARVPGFVVDDLDRALYRDRTLVRVGALRGSGFLIPVERVDAVASASDRRGWHEGAVDKAVGRKKRLQWTSQVLDILDGEILLAREIRARLGVSGKESEPLRFLLSSLTDSRTIVAASGVRSWRDNQHGYAIWDQWLPDHPVRLIDPDEARAEVARWYLHGHGPASVEDFSWWSGISKAKARHALDSVAEVEGDLYDIGGRLNVDPPSGLRLLPIWDTALVTQKTRRRMVDERLYPYVYDASGNLTSTIVLDGEVIGIRDRSGDADYFEIKVSFFSGAGPRELVETEANVIAAAVGAGDSSVEVVDGFVDLTRASWNRFMSPLSGD